MKRWIIAMTMGAAMLCASCGQKQETGQNVTAYPGGRDEYAGAAERRLAAIGARIDSLKTEIDSSSSKAKVELQQEVARLEVERQEATVKLQTLKTAAGQRWNELKLDLANLLDDMDRGFDRARTKLRESAG